MANNKIINTDQLQLALNEFYNQFALPNIAFILDIRQNLNGKTLSAYTQTYMSGTYPGYKIQKNSANLTKQEASEFLNALSGTKYVPLYNYDIPMNSYLIRATDGMIYKPQYDNTNGLVLYEMKKVLTSGQVTASDVNSSTATSGQVLTADGTGGATWQNASGGGSSVGAGFNLIVRPSGNWGGSYYEFYVLGEYNGVYGWHYAYVDPIAFHNVIKGTIDDEPFTLPSGQDLVFSHTSMFVNENVNNVDILLDLHLIRYDGTTIANTTAGWNNAFQKICYLTGDCILSSED